MHRWRSAVFNSRQLSQGARHLERDMQMPAEYVERMHELCRRERQRLYQEITGGAADIPDGPATVVSIVPQMARPAAEQPAVSEKTPAVAASPRIHVSDVTHPVHGGSIGQVEPPYTRGDA